MKWIDCSERMPERWAACLIAVKDDATHGLQSMTVNAVVYWCGDRWELLGGTLYATPVTHWMPLPAPPYDGNGERRECD